MSLAFETLGETIAVFDRSGEVVSTTKHLYNVFKEAQQAYQKARTGLVDQYNATFGPSQDQSPVQRQLSWDDEGSGIVQAKPDQGIIRPRHHQRSQSLDSAFELDGFRPGLDQSQLCTEDARAKPAFIPDDNESVFLSRLDDEDDGIDTELAFGEYHAETFEQIHRDAEEDMKKLMSKTQQMLMEAKCAEASAMATINHLQENPEAMAAVALTLAEVSKLAKTVGPHILNALKVAFPSAFALLACPQFLVASSVGIGITIVMIGGYKIIKRIQAACSDEETVIQAPPMIEEKRPFPAHLIDDFAPPKSPWSPPPMSLHTPTIGPGGDAQWAGIPRMASRMAVRPEIDRDEMYELESTVTGVNSWLRALDAEGSRHSSKPDEELMTPLAVKESGFFFNQAGQIHPPPRRRHTSDRNPHQSNHEAVSPGSRASYAESAFSGSASSSASSSSHDGSSRASHERPRAGRRHDISDCFDLGDDEEVLYTKDGKPVRVRRNRARSARRSPAAEEVERHARARAPREARPKVGRSHRSHSTDRRSRSRPRDAAHYPERLPERFAQAPLPSQPPAHTLRRVKSISSPSEAIAPLALPVRRSTNETHLTGQSSVAQKQAAPQPAKLSRAAKMMGILTLGMSNREGRSSRQAPAGSSRRSKSASDENRGRHRGSAGEVRYRSIYEEHPENTTSARPGARILQRQVQDKGRGGAAAAQAWFEKRGKHERRPSKLNPSTSEAQLK
ncbi:hypothetical protein KEM52_002947 [Ascosphaera acerosa]|nr:hypothetical protein KEM52_002947 [Ascosphaera acerosa]